MMLLKPILSDDATPPSAGCLAKICRSFRGFRFHSGLSSNGWLSFSTGAGVVVGSPPRGYFPSRPPRFLCPPEGGCVHVLAVGAAIEVFPQFVTTVPIGKGMFVTACKRASEIARNRSAVTVVMPMAVSFLSLVTLFHNGVTRAISAAVFTSGHNKGFR
jgi:hypothetical protein